MRTANLPPERRAQLSAMIEERLGGYGHGPASLAREAQSFLRTMAKRGGCEAAGIRADEWEIKLWSTLQITKRHIEGLLNCPARPLANPERVARLLAVCLVLGLDRAKVNRLAGGV